MWQQSCLAFKLTSEVVTLLKRCLYKQDSQQNGIMGGAGVTF